MPSIKLFNAGRHYIQSTMRFFIPPVTFILVFILINIFFATTALSKEKILIKVGVYENNPKIYTASNGDVTGFWPDLIAHIANKENWDIKYVHGSWNECLERLLENKIDIMPDVAFTEKRNKIYAFSKNSVLTSWSRLYVKQHDKGIKSITDLQNKKIAALNGSVNLEGVGGIKEIVQSFNINCTYLELDNYNKVFEAVNNNLADAGVTNRNYGNKNEKKFNLKKTAIIFQPVNMKFAFPKKSPIAQHCSERIEYHMDSFLEDSNSLYYQLLEKYFETEIAHKTVEVFPIWLKTGLKSIGALLSFLFLVIFISRVQVKRKTRELETKNKALCESEAHYRQLFDSLPYGGEIIDTEGKITNCSRSTSLMLGYKMD
ncbi:MAG: transporter substrate-binding domain-containing protein [Desulfobacteraceae bacterium]|nr:transporter substrate-binding domain-containing protein [Desulfobacteraceae bacterium]